MERLVTLRVVKLGGSLISLPDWPDRLQRWLSDHPASINLVFVGGGEIVEAVRELDALHHFPDAFSHWLCVDLLSATLRIACQLLPEWQVIRTPGQLKQVVESIQTFGCDDVCHQSLQLRCETIKNFVVDVHSFYDRPGCKRSSTSELEQPTDPEASSPFEAIGQASGTSESTEADEQIANCELPENWNTTSDSLAAWLAEVAGAQELILLKSTTPPSASRTPQSWVELGIVDAVFAAALPANLSVRIVNLATYG